MIIDDDAGAFALGTQGILRARAFNNTDRQLDPRHPAAAMPAAECHWWRAKKRVRR